MHGHKYMTIARGRVREGARIEAFAMCACMSGILHMAT